MKTRVLILCIGNSCRSQTAEGILRRYGSDKFEVESVESETLSTRSSKRLP
ncbi:MAG: hypothetical protein HYZ85_05100 [Candidatus Omnitrophica bacterium]|nr:hypothetical protein [Candidatus Omnitrophota bacterium]